MGRGTESLAGGQGRMFGSAGLNLIKRAVVPRDDGLHANDWLMVMPNYLSLPVRPVGCYSVRQWVWRVDDESGTGSNNWTVSARYVANASDHQDYHIVFPMPSGFHLSWYPRRFASGDLPFDVYHEVPASLVGTLAFLFARTGTGNHKLTVRVWSDLA